MTSRRGKGTAEEPGGVRGLPGLEALRQPARAVACGAVFAAERRLDHDTGRLQRKCVSVSMLSRVCLARPGSQLDTFLAEAAFTFSGVQMRFSDCCAHGQPTAAFVGTRALKLLLKADVATYIGGEGR